MMQNSLTERITRSLAYMLRHQPEEFDLELDDYGFAELEDVVCALNERLGEPIREQDVVDALSTGDRPRYEIVDSRVRALYGHSIPIDPGEPTQPPDRLFIGVSANDAGRALKNGLQGGRRTFLHLAKTAEEAEEAGKRLGGDWSVITVRAREAWEEGINFFDRKALYLSEFIPTEFLEVGDVRRGIPLEREREGGWSRGGPGRRPEGRDRPHRGRDDQGRGHRVPEVVPKPRVMRDEIVPQRATPPTSAPARPAAREREARPERRETEERPELREREDRRESARLAPVSRATTNIPARDATAGPNFGLGVFEPPSPPTRAAAAERVRPPEPPPPQPEAPTPPESKPDGGFGAGIT